MHRTIASLSLSVGVVASIMAAASRALAGDAAAESQPALTGAIITECTDAGRKARTPTADRPVYVEIQSGGRRDFGRHVGGQEAPTDASLQQQLAAAIAADHYLAATAEHPPSVFLLLVWGLHANLDPDMEDPGYTNVLDRAALVGGSKFAKDLKAALSADAMAAAATSDQPYGAQLPGMNPTRASILFQGLSPIVAFRKRDPLTRRLLDQIASDSYYVVVSALDYPALVKGERRLLWRTKLSANAQGAAMAGTLSALLRAGTGWFGRDMSGPELVPVPAR